MTTDFTRISDHLYLFADTCNVYVLKDGDRGILIDSGSGKILSFLEQIGISQIDWVLHTHHHRDQCWGDHQLIERGARIAVPEYEHYLFAKAEKLWEDRRIYDNYNDRNTFFSVGEDIAVETLLKDYDTVRFGSYQFKVLPAKGHTLGSISLIAEIDGECIAFTGDLMHEGGKLYQLHAMEYNYGDMFGLLFTHQSISKLAKEEPQTCLPSHGPMIEQPAHCITQLKDRLRRLVRLTTPEQEEHLNEHVYPVSRHLLWGGASTSSNFYVLMSNSGKALLIDYGMGFGEHLRVRTDRDSYERVRFVEHHLQELFVEHGIRKIDAVLVTHIHDDHICGIPFLQKHYGVECWTIEEVAKVIEDPPRWSSTPCCFDTPIKVHRRYEDNEEFEWEEYSIRMHYTPGQTEFHATVSALIDGVKVAFTGDNIFLRASASWGSHVHTQPVQRQFFRNSFQFWMHEKCKDVIREIMPERICPGHQEPFDFYPSRGAAYCDFIDQKEALFRELSPEPAEQSVDLFWTRLIPYQSTVEPGEAQEFTLLVRNNFPQEAEFKARLLVPPGWQVLNEFDTLSLISNSKGEIEMAARAPVEFPKSARQLITAEVFVDEVSCGPVAEALVTVGTQEKTRICT